MLGPPLPSLGQCSVPNMQDFDQSCARVAPGLGNINVSVSHDVHNVAPSASTSFGPSSLLFPFSDSGFASLPASVPPSSAPTFSSLAPSPPFTPLPLFTLPSVVPFILSLSSSSSAPSFPLQQFPRPFGPSAAPPSSHAPLCFPLLLFLQFLFVVLLVVRLRTSFLRLRSLPLFLLRLPRFPLCPPLLHSPLSGSLRGSLLSLLCPLLLLLLLQPLEILRTFRQGCWVSPRNIKRWVVGLWPLEVRIFALTLLLTVLTSILIFMLTLPPVLLASWLL